MNCLKFVKIISAYIDMEAGIIEQQALREHLKSCQHCKNELLSQYKLSSIINENRRKQIHIDVSDVVMLNITARHKAKEKSKGHAINKAINYPSKPANYRSFLSFKAYAIVATIVLTVATLFIAKNQDYYARRDAQPTSEIYASYIYRHASIDDGNIQSKILHIRHYD